MTADTSQDKLNNVTGEPAATAHRSGRLFRRLLMMLFVVVVTPVVMAGYRAQRQLAFIRDVEDRNGDVDTELRGPEWLRKLIGDERMRGFERMTHVTIEAARDDDLQYLARRPLPRTLILVDPGWTEQGVRELRNFDGIFELGFWRVRHHRAEALRELSRFESVTKLSFFDMELADEELQALSELKSLKSLMIQQTSITGSGLAHLRDLPLLNFVNVGTNDLTDGGLAALEALTQVDFLLSLAHTEITDEGLSHVKPLTKLRHLVLANTQITDAGLEHLSELTELQVLNLTDAAITDAGLPCLYHFSKLQELDLTGTQVTEEGMQQLKTALPGCEVVYRLSLPNYSGVLVP